MLYSLKNLAEQTATWLSDKDNLDGNHCSLNSQIVKQFFAHSIHIAPEYWRTIHETAITFGSNKALHIPSGCYFW
ncbi:hypothetical protein KsCSTR_06190 [Candidatus Kuenenia stuttgartiensis]|uniref:Uncharacterized protein n=1 Tax=Kuenenia stuttgartiensis TaxID=174633 RepID=Q1PZX0_KUEST|nr:hypothetical protein KsCSTR_06190 [Candidatus Kuenenia stuttgartiensis]CAJ72624.1 unknown protein [Candidatus Kuenenia stuttgartiensis]